MWPIVKILMLFDHFGVHFAKMDPKEQEFLRFYKVSSLLFPGARNSNIPKGFARFAKVTEWHCEIVKFLMVLMLFLTSNSEFALKMHHFPQRL